MSKQARLGLPDVTEVLDMFFGPQRPSAPLSVIDGRITCQIRSETDLRKSLAMLARAAGWLVQEELVVPGWGRIDLVLREEVFLPPYLVELKLDLTKQAAVRKAFQQADGYGRWWSTTRGEAATVIVVPAEFDDGLMSAVQAAYPTLQWHGLSEFIYVVTAMLDRPRGRVARANALLADLKSLVEVHEMATAQLTAEVGAGQIALPGLELYAYEPDRLMDCDNEGTRVRVGRASPHQLAAAAERAQEAADKGNALARQKREEAAAYSAWAVDHYTPGRAVAVTFDAFVRESGVWVDRPAVPKSDGEGE